MRAAIIPDQAIGAVLAAGRAGIFRGDVRFVLLLGQDGLGVALEVGHHLRQRHGAGPGEAADTAVPPGCFARGHPPSRLPGGQGMGEFLPFFARVEVVRDRDPNLAAVNLGLVRLGLRSPLHRVLLSFAHSMTHRGMLLAGKQGEFMDFPA